MSVNSTSPATLFGGTWEQIQDKFLLCAGSTYSAGSTGGSADAVIVSHYHRDLVWDSTGRTIKAGSGSGADLISITSNGAQSGTYSIRTSTNGVDGTGKNMPPYLSVYVWKRTA